MSEYKRRDREQSIRLCRDLEISFISDTYESKLEDTAIEINDSHLFCITADDIEIVKDKLKAFFDDIEKKHSI